MPKHKYPLYDVPMVVRAIGGAVPLKDVTDSLQMVVDVVGDHSPLLENLPTAMTLFSGLGASAKALRDLGHERVLTHDFMREAVASLNANGFDAVQGDIRDVDFSSPFYSRIKVIEGSPPCQPFSQRDMIPDFQRAVAQTLPELFVLENVRGLASPRHRDYLNRRKDEFRAIGYAVEHRVIDAADYGAPQSRKRMFMLGMRLDVAQRRIDEMGHPIIWPQRSERRITMAEALGWDRREAYVRNLMAPTPARNEAAAQWVYERPSTTVVGSFRPEVQAAPGYRTAGSGPRQNAPGSVVTTPAERLILQQMPADWKVCGSRTKVDLQIGNSVPCEVIKSLFALNSTTTQEV